MIKKKKKEAKHRCITCGMGCFVPYFKVDNSSFPEKFVRICGECRKKVKTLKKFIHEVTDEEKN